MEDIKKLEEKVDKAKQDIMALARQNTEYNSEIVRLKSFKETAEKDVDKISGELKRITALLADKQGELNVLDAAILKAKETLFAETEARDQLFKSAEKEKADVIDRLAFLRGQRSDLENEIASLSTQSFNAGVTINTQNFTISENNIRVNKSKSELSEIERRIGVANMELRSIEDKIKEKTAELQAKVDILTERNDELTASVEAKKKELSDAVAEIDRKNKWIDEKISSAEESLAGREQKLSDDVKKCASDAELNARTLSALNDREQELKLLELKIRELARKKDIDAQIASLSK